MPRAWKHLDLMIRRIASQVPHIDRLHDLIVAATDPEAWHGQLRHQLGQASHRTALGAVEQQASGSTAIALEPRQGTADLAQSRKRPALVNPTATAQQNDPLELIPQQGSGMEHNTAAERMAEQHQRATGSTLFGFLRQPTAVGRQGWAQAWGALSGAKARQIRRPAGPLRLKLLLQGLPNAPTQQPTMGHHQLGVRFS